MPPEPTSGRPHRIRLAILDDNPFVRTADGTVHPRAALFHRFAEAVVAAGPFEPAAYLVPVAAADGRPALGPVDPTRLRVVDTAPFAGIAGYARRAVRLGRHNWPVIRDAVAGADLLWIKAPASNAPLAAVAARRAGVPRFTWIAGSAREVVRGQGRRGAAGGAARLGAAAYDGLTSLLARTGPAISLDDRLFTSLVTRDDVEATLAHPGRPIRSGGGLRIAWSGRMVTDKGLDDLLEAVASLSRDGSDVSLDLIGDGPARPDLEATAERLGLDGRIRWLGYVGDRRAYLDALRDGDVFVLPSRAEGVPKVVVDAMAAGLPVVATSVGGVPAILADGARGRLVRPGDPGGLAAAIGSLASDAEERGRLRAAGLAFAAGHTIDAQAERLIGWLERTFPDLRWAADRP